MADLFELVSQKHRKDPKKLGGAILIPQSCVCFPSLETPLYRLTPARSASSQKENFKSADRREIAVRPQRPIDSSPSRPTWSF